MTTANRLSRRNLNMIRSFIRSFIHRLLPNDTAIVIAGIAVVLAFYGVMIWADPPQPNVCPHSTMACVH